MKKTEAIELICTVPNRRLSVVSASLVALLAVTSLPTIFYIWDPPAKQVERSTDDVVNISGSDSCDNGQRVNWTSLVGSMCANYLEWQKGENKSAHYSRKISTLKCNFDDTEKNLQDILSLLLSGVPDLECQKQATPILCHYLYRDCDVELLRPTTEDCLKVKHGACQNEWNLAAIYLPRSASLSACIGIPDCSADFDNSSTANHTTSFSGSTNLTNHNESIASGSTSSKGNGTVDCTPPLVEIELNDLDYPLGCSPACLEKNWSSKPELAVMEVMLYLTGIVSFFCVVVTFVTWANVAELRQFPQNTLLFLVIAYAIASFLVHVGLTSALVWWLCSIFNVFVSIYVISPVNPIRRYSKTVLVIETVTSVALPVGLAAAVLGVEGRYATFSVQIITCGPPSVKLMYYTMALPLQLIVFVGVVMTLLIMLRLRKVQDANKHSTVTSMTVSPSSQTTIQNRFLMIVVFFPLCLGVIMSTIVVYEKLSEDAVASFVDYVVCVGSKTARACEKPNYGSIITSILDLIMFNIFSLVLLAYVLVPTMARKFWIRRLRNVRNRLATLLSKESQTGSVETESGKPELTLTGYANRVTDPYTEVTIATPTVT
ncbi:uncharacterized protein LOC134183840 isoform X2 [Corticium candelabrum]|uniref:uncharacterized protein LOC134183840 isoform X2 n=1 Tax=Corticium candelabrum TaxID=121492 RepID=UPI002E254FC6|nr:uncharacterized protein LOC134183840 isoform X2 [Corticium candelabrum]